MPSQPPPTSSLLTPVSTPAKIHSSQPSGSSDVRQKKLKNTLYEELSDQTWQFPPQEFAQRMRPPGVNLPRRKVVDEAAKVILKKFPRKPKGGEDAHYQPLATILNTCIAISNSIIKDHQIIPESAKQWFGGLGFISWAKPMGDGVNGASPLKPDLAGILDPPIDNLALYWGQVEEGTGDTARRLVLPGEVKGSWAELMKQAATYARALNSATIFRAFELVLGYKYTSDQFRILIFHRGGVSSSGGISLYTKSTSNIADLLIMFVSMMTWTSPDHAGLPLFTDGQQIKLPDPVNPRDPARSMILTLQKVIYHTLAIRSRNTCVVLASSATKSDTPTKSDAPMQSDVPTKSDAPTKRGTPMNLRLTTMMKRVRYQTKTRPKTPNSLVLKGPNQSQSNRGSRVTTNSRLTRGNNGKRMKPGLAQGNNRGDSTNSRLAPGNDRGKRVDSNTIKHGT